MKCEIPEVGRCCFCLPLRLGLIVWGYLKLIASVMLFTSMTINLLQEWDRFWRTVETTFSIIYIFILLSMATDIVFLIIFAISAHRKDARMMDWFLKFSIYIFGMYVLILCLSIAYSTNADHFFAFYFGFLIGIIAFSCSFSQIYIIILVRSEVLKLKRGSNFQFINHGAGTADSVKINLDSNDNA
ncbi:uncharacterized protein LOC123660863 [Melitaea cinxia]|uniref:uncharacterized protein LOC123660863 n=1 Tax=Melitaea cinxia TaxID=113334 RepID=UPI001E27153D|nr:uncharacterized protein LOC123660863 [Melitaea cinxia]